MHAFPNVLPSVAGLANLKSGLPWSKGKKSLKLMVPVATQSQFGDATFQRRQMPSLIR